jgi:predicted HAD superfamily phosphohydrolase YqeG
MPGKKSHHRRKRSPSPAKKKSELLIVFDIDETLIQFLHEKHTDAMELWKNVDERDKSTLAS